MLVALIPLVADIVAAGKPPGGELTGCPSPRIRLGEQTTSTLLVTNPGPRRFRGALKIRGSRRREPVRQSIAGCARGRSRASSPRCIRRAAVTGPAIRVTVRRPGLLGLGGRQRSVAVGGGVTPCRRSDRVNTCRRGWPGCVSSTAARPSGSAGRAPEFDSLRDYVEGDDVRSIDWRATARRRSTWCRGSPNATGTSSWCSTPRVRARPAWAMHPGSTHRWTPRCCWPPSRPTPVTGGPDRR